MASAAPAGDLHPITAAPELFSGHGTFGGVVSFHSQDAQENRLRDEIRGLPVD
jgi:hypothetical protein